jgi:hypothetical protein
VWPPVYQRRWSQSSIIRTHAAADCKQALRTAIASKMCTAANGFAGPTCPILSVPSGFCGGWRGRRCLVAGRLLRIH